MVTSAKSFAASKQVLRRKKCGMCREEKFLNTCRRACVFFCARNDGNDGLTARKTPRCFIPSCGVLLNCWNWQFPCRTAPVPPECPLRLHPNCRVNSEGHGSRRAGEFRPNSRRKSQQTLLHCWGIFSIKYLYVQLHPSGIKRKGLSEGCFQAGGHLGKGHMCFAGTVLF